MAAPTTEEETLLISFRMQVNDILETEEQRKASYLVRWLRARDLNLSQAENMLRNSLAWRKENNIDHILELGVDPYFEKHFPFYINGVDKKGQPVVVASMGIWDFRGCVAKGKTEELKQYIIYRFEQVCWAAADANKTRDPNLYPVTQITLIVDWAGFSYRQLCSWKAMQALLYTAMAYEAHYPEILSSALFLNCPSYFGIVVKMIKHIVAARTFEKIKVYGSDRKEWENACKKIITDDQLELALKFLC